MSSEYHIYIIYIYSCFYIYIYIHMNLVLSDSTKFRESADCLIQLSATTTSTTEGLFSRQIFPPLQAPVPTGVLADGCRTPARSQRHSTIRRRWPDWSSATLVKSAFKATFSAMRAAVSWKHQHVFYNKEPTSVQPDPLFYLFYKAVWNICRWVTLSHHGHDDQAPPLMPWLSCPLAALPWRQRPWA